jgi:hypothetical protein
MKLAIVSIALFSLVGCATTHSLPPENYGITETVTKKPSREVTVKPIENLPKIQGQPQMETIYIVDEESKLTPEQFEALSKAIEEAVRGKEGTCLCKQGDPLCSCINSNDPEIKFDPPR